jgi:hypothetical protein
MRTSYRQVTRHRHCPVCDGDHKCGIGSDGSVQCGRVPDGLRPGDQCDGHVFLGRSEKDPQFGLFRAIGDRVLQARGEERQRDRDQQRRHSARTRTAHHDEDGADQRPDFEGLAKKYVANLTPERAAELAEALGLRPDVLSRLPLLGWLGTDPHGPCWTMPEVDGASRVVGLLRRFRKDGRKLAVEGSGRGLIVPQNWDSGEGPVFAVEGPSDTLAMVALGLNAVGRPSNHGGVAHLAKLLQNLPASRAIIVVAEWDQNEKGQWPGLDGAKATATKLAEALRRPVFWSLPTKQSKDVRAWLLAQNLPADCLDAWHVAGEQLSTHLVEKAQEIKPPMSGGETESFSASDLLGTDLPEPRYAVDGMIVEGMSVLAGKPKLGKSWMALNFAIASAEGGTALGSINVEGGDVLYLALEDTKRRLQGRLRKLLSAQQGVAPARLTLVTRCPRQGAGGLEFLEKWLQSHPDARLIIIDTWPKFRPPKARGRDPYEEDYEHATQLKALADRYGVAILVVAHCRKLDADDPVDAVSGTLGLTGAADGVLVLKRERGRHDATLFVTGRDIEEQELALGWDPRFALWSIAGQADEYRMSKDRSELLSLLRREGPLTPKQAAEKLQKTANAVQMLLRKLEGEGHVKGNAGHYAPCYVDRVDSSDS